jgi:hypothetical protein
MTRSLIALGLASLALAAVLYFQTGEDAAVVVTDADRELIVTSGVSEVVEFPVHNPTRHLVRVIGLTQC